MIRNKLISDAAFLEIKTEYEIAQANVQTAVQQIEVARAASARADEELAKTTIYAPTDGTISRLNSELGERVVGTATMAGTEVMIIADLNTMDALVEVSEADVVLIQCGQRARLKVDAFRGKRFEGTVVAIASAAKPPTTVAAGSSSLEAIRFEVRIRITGHDGFRPGMSVTAEIETRTRTNVIAVPIQCVTTRVPKAKTSLSVKAASPIEVVFVEVNDRVKVVPVERGISDDTYVEILGSAIEGLNVVTGDYKAVQRELEDGRKIQIVK